MLDQSAWKVVKATCTDSAEVLPALIKEQTVHRIAVTVQLYLVKHIAAEFSSRKGLPSIVDPKDHSKSVKKQVTGPGNIPSLDFSFRAPGTPQVTQNLDTLHTSHLLCG